MKKNKENTTFNMQLELQLKKDFFKKCIENRTDMSKVPKEYIKRYTYEN